MRRVAMVPPAPGWLTATIFSASQSFSAITRAKVRATVSILPPGSVGTITFIGRSG